MRNTIIVGSILALVGFASVVQASDRSKRSDHDVSRVHSEVSDDTRRERHNRYERSDRSRERHGETNERAPESQERHNEPEHQQDRN